ncbi:deoxyribonuclease-1-like protein [Sarotherodon galilaeus]
MQKRKRGRRGSGWMDEGWLELSVSSLSCLSSSILTMLTAVFQAEHRLPASDCILSKRMDYSPVPLPSFHESSPTCTESIPGSTALTTSTCTKPQSHHKDKMHHNKSYLLHRCILCKVKRKSQSSMRAGMQATSGLFSMTAGLLVSHDTALCAWTFD